MNWRWYAIGVVMVFSFANSGARAEEKAHTVRGQVQEVNLADHRLKILSDDNQELAFRLDDQSKWEPSGKTLAADDLAKGKKVRVWYTTTEGENRVTSIEPAHVSGEALQNDVISIVRDAKNFAYEHRGAYRRRLMRVEQRLDDRIAVLQNEAANASGETKQSYERQIERLRRLRTSVKERAAAVESATADDWNDVRSRVGSVLEQVGNALQDRK